MAVMAKYKSLLLKLSLTLMVLASSQAIASYSSPESAFDAVRGINNHQDFMDKKLRERAIENAAFAYGVREGRLYQLEKINTYFQQHEQYLDTIFNFKALYLYNGELQPPVLSDARHVALLNNNGKRKTTILQVYRVISDAKLTNTAITWRNFLLSTQKATKNRVSKALLPKNSNEEVIWRAQIKSGWKHGILAANNEAKARLASLSQSFEGMLLYRKLAQQGMVEPPEITHSAHNVQLSSDAKTLNIDSSTRIISKDSYFVGKPHQYKPAMYGLSQADVRS